MAKRISKKNEGQLFHLRFNSPYNPYEMKDVKLLEVFKGDRDEERARFEDPEIGEWEAYKYNGRWAYGSSADRLSVIE
jgi:hypothetical protein